MTSQEELDYCYNFTLDLVIKSGKIIQDAFQESKTIKKKAADWDLVTQYDTKVEEILINNLAERFPTHKFIGEETVSHYDLPALTDVPTWIIDPIDGTTNFIHSFPHICISVALTVNKELQIGIIYNPILQQLFTAKRGQGAFLNERPITSSNVEELKDSLLCFESTLAIIENIRDIVLGRLEAFVSRAQGIRTLGSAALTMCYVAMGTVEGYHCHKLMPWDVAAGVLIIREAGGIVIDTNGGEFNIMSPNLIAAANDKLANEFVRLIKDADLKTHQRRRLLQNNTAK